VFDAVEGISERDKEILLDKNNHSNARSPY